MWCFLALIAGFFGFVALYSLMWASISDTEPMFRHLDWVFRALGKRRQRIGRERKVKKLEESGKQLSAVDLQKNEVFKGLCRIGAWVGIILCVIAAPTLLAVVVNLLFVHAMPLLSSNLGGSPPVNISWKGWQDFAGVWWLIGCCVHLAYMFVYCIVYWVQGGWWAEKLREEKLREEQQPQE